MIGKTISHYRIVEKLGEGGMGVVYKAHDTKLDRDVALKFLPPELTRDPDARARFILEAQAASALDHPNICTIYEIDETADGQLFIVMPAYEGSSLHSKIDQGPLLFDEGIDIAIQIAQGLQEAHSKGFFHRDIKPANIMITNRGEVKILDFGLAKLAGGQQKMTKTGSTLGTVAYMSAEQASGSKVDKRTDIWSLGVLIYETLTGQLPFRGDYDQAMIYSIINEEPQPISLYLPDTSSHLKNIIERALEKDPDDRYQSMEDLLSDLRRLRRKTTKMVATPLSSASKTLSASGKQHDVNTQTQSPRRLPIAYIAALSIIAIAVVASYLIFFVPAKPINPLLKPNRVFVAAFENRTGDPTLDPIGRLVSDWITQGILHNEVAEVITTTTMLQMIQHAGLVGGGLEDRTKLIKLAEATQSGILVSGMFHQVGEDIQLHAQIIDAQKNNVILTLEPVRGPRSEPMKAINDLQQKIMGALAMRARPGGDIRMSSEPPIYEAYLESMEGTKYFGVDYEKAFEHYQRAIEIDPKFLDPKLRMAVGYGNISQYSKADSILQSVNRERHRLNPFERSYLDWYTFTLQGKLEEAFGVLLYIESMTPMHPTTNYIVGLYALYLNRPKIVVETYAKIDFQDYWTDYAIFSWRFVALCSAHHLLGNYQKELEVAREAQKYFPNDLDLRSKEVCALAVFGKVEELYQVIEHSKSIEPSAGSVSAGYVMLAASRELRAHGNKIEALKFAEQSFQWYNDNDKENKSGLAKALYSAERWDESHTLYKELAAENPDDITYKGALGALAARTGNAAEARYIADELKSIDRKYLFGWHTYLRARIHALLGEHAEAVKLIQESFNLGNKFGVYIHNDIDLESLYNYPPFKSLLKPKG